MTEDGWAASRDPTAMLGYAADLVGERKLRLFACACCRAVWTADWPHWTRKAVEAAERFADGVLSAKELNDIRSVACQSAQMARVTQARSRTGEPDVPIFTRLMFAADAALPGSPFFVDRNCALRYDPQLRELAPPLLRCIIGNPFRPVSANPGWLTPTAVALACQVYESRDFALLPILADALQDAGCEDPDLLGHCRGDGPHTLGCWVVDLVLGKG